MNEPNIEDNYNNEHCMGFRWEAIYRIKPYNDAIFVGAEVFYSWNGKSGVEILNISQHAKNNEDVLKFHDKYINEMIQIMNKHNKEQL